MKNLIRKILKEQLDDDSIKLEIYKKELKEVEEDYDDIIAKYNLLKKKIEILEYRKDIPYVIGYTKDEYGNEYVNVRIDYPYAETKKRYPYYRIYIGQKKELDRLDQTERDKKIRYTIRKYLNKKFPV